MELIMLILWLMVFLIFLVVNIAEKSNIWGAIAGFWLLTMGLFVIVDGIQYESGIEIVEAGATTTLTYQYSEATLPYSTYSFVWGIIFLSLSIYIVYANLLKKK